MKLTRHDLEIELPEEWWNEAGMAGFEPQFQTYNVDFSEHPSVRQIRIMDIGPINRAPGVGIFNDDEKGSARERVVSILRGFRAGSLIPPIEVVEGGGNSSFQWKVTHGAHRLYCSLAAGFSHVPTVPGFDMSTLDQ